MQRYKSIFSEAEEGNPTSEKDVKNRVDISNLTWMSAPSKLDWETAIKKPPKGYRLPTIQELYTAWEKEIPGFKQSTYWSSSQPLLDNESAWYCDFEEGEVDNSEISSTLNVKYVKANKKK